jgi:uncharacterized protein (TIGR00255 family)
VIRSMTGFGEASAQIDGIHYFVEVRSLNSKYLKASIRLPDAFQGLEAEMESALRRRLARGTITLTATCTDVSESAAFEINYRALDRYIEQIRRATNIASGAVSLDVAALLSLPGVLQPPADEEARLHRARAAFLPLLERACDSLIQMRGREGQALLKDLIEQRDLIATRLAAIAERAPAVVADYEKRLQTRIETLLTAADRRVEPVELIREIAVYAERTDIAEEIKRLGGHIEQFTSLISSGGGEDDRPVGRTLDFLAQEMLREANTIASKSPDSDISRAIVEVKGAIDRIKEQVQNVE